MSGKNPEQELKGGKDVGEVAGDGPETSSASAASASADAPMQKKPHKKRKASKGRLKKLWRRALTPPGITSPSEWFELMELHSDWKSSHESNQQNGVGGGGGVATDQEAMLGPLPGPSVLLTTKLRDFRNGDNWQSTEGSDHRDILMNLLFNDGGTCQNSATQPKKKRKKSGSPPTDKSDNKQGTHQGQSSSKDNVPTLPSWSNISNIASVGGVAVIEIEINDGQKDDVSNPLMASQRIRESTNAETANVWSSLLQNASTKNDTKVRRTISAACKVKLFQGDKQPRCLSDVLMYHPPPSAETKAKLDNGSIDLFRAMNDLLLKPKQLRSEGFPIQSKDTDNAIMDTKVAKDMICKMSAAQMTVGDIKDSSDCNALDLVSSLSINAVLGDENDLGGNNEDDDDFSKTEYYVKTCSIDRSANDYSFNKKSEAKSRQKVFALDCEMVKTSDGPELARISLIQYTADAANEEKSVVVLDELVKPRRKVLNYLTEYSGITPKMLHDEGLATRIEHIQACLLSIIDENDIAVGHSLENDLRALRLVHTKVIDTSVIFRGVNGRKFSLRHLSNVLLQKKIQQGCGSTGHCSTEDAEAALVLALRRARRGNSFRLKENSARQNILTLFQKVNRAASDQSNETGSFAERNDGSCVCIGPNDWIMKYAQSNGGSHHVLSCDSILGSMSMSVPSWLSSEKSSKRAGFLWARLRCEDKSSQNEVKKLDEILVALVDRVPSHIPILLMFQRNFNKAASLAQQRKAANNPKASCGWTSAQEEHCKTYMEQSRQCEAIWIGSACK